MAINKGATVAVRVITQATPLSGELLGFVENFNCGKVMNAEIFVPLGAYSGTESLYHGETGQFSWGEAHTHNDFVARGLVPAETNQDTFRDWTLRITRRTDGTKLAHLRGAVPNSADLAIASMSRVNSNLSGVCQLVQFGSEFNAPGTV